MISQAIIKIQCKKLLLQETFKLNFQRNAKRKIEFHKQALSTLRRILLYSYLLATGHIYFFTTPNVSLEDDEHLLHISKYRYTQVQSHKPWFWSHFIGRESRKWDREDKSYISINTYTQHITLRTWHLQYIIIKDLSWRKNIFQWECLSFLLFFSFFFATGI